MLAFIRKALSSWVVLVLLGLLLVAFIITGIGDPFGGGIRPGTVAEVGGEAITEAELSQQFDRFLRRAREEQPALTADQFVRAGGLDQVLEQIIGAEALEQFGRRQGVAVSERSVDGEIASIPAFQLAGRFDQTTYEQVLAQQRITDKELRDGLRGDLIRRQLVVPVAASPYVPRSLVAPYASLLLERRTGSIAVVPSDRMTGVPDPTDAQIQTFYNQNKSTYTIPERRAFRYAFIDSAALLAAIKIPDADIKRYYDENQATYGGIEQRTLSQVVVPDEAKAKQIVARVRKGESFVQVAAQVGGYSAEDLALGVQTRERFAEATNDAVASAAFALPQGGITDPIKSDFGFHIVRVDAITPGRARPLSEVRGEIEATLRTERGQDVLAETVAAIEDKLAEGESFADVAREYRLQIVEVPAITRDGRVQENPGFTLDARAVPLVGRAFDAEAGDEPTVQELGENDFAVLEVGDIIAPTPVPLAQIRPAVAADWQRVERMKRARQVADAIIAEVNKGTSLAAALSSRKLPAAQPVAGSRIQLSRQQQVPPPIALMFSLPQGSVRLLEAPRGQGWFIVKLDQVVPGNADSAPQLIGAIRQQMTQVAADELAGQFTRAIQAQVGVERDPGTIAKLRRRLLGEGDAPAQ